MLRFITGALGAVAGVIIGGGRVRVAHQRGASQYEMDEECRKMSEDIKKGYEIGKKAAPAVSVLSGVGKLSN